MRSESQDATSLQGCASPGARSESHRAYTERDLRAAAVALAEHEEAHGLMYDVQRQQFLDGWLREPYVGDPDPTAPSAAARALAEFHEHPNALPETTNTQALRRTLHQEEHEELIQALEIAAAPLVPGSDRIALSQVARELADVVYVAYGTAWAFGIDLDAALVEIHRAAMDKMEAGLRREDGKILKPPGFVPPDMSAAIAGAALDGSDR